MLAVIAALPAEIGPLLPLLRERRKLRLDAPAAWTARLEGAPCAVLITGVGMDRARAGVQALLRRVRLHHAIALGFGGALSESLEAGDIVLGTEVIDRSGRSDPHRTDPGLRERCALPDGPFRTVAGPLVTVPAPLRTPAEKLELGRATGALACDMESAGVAAALLEAGIACVFARAVVDEAGLELPPGVERLLGPDGRPRPFAISRLLVSRPASIPRLAALAARSRKAAGHLALLARLAARELGAGAGPP